MTMIWTVLREWRVGPAIAHFLTTSLPSLLRNFAPPTVCKFRFAPCSEISLLPLCANFARTSSFAKANNGFCSSAAGLYPRGFGPAVELEIPIPSWLRARCLLKQTTAFTQCWDFGSISMDPINNQCMGLWSRTPP